MSFARLAVEIRTHVADDFEREVAPLLGAHRLQVHGRAGRQSFFMRHRALPRLGVSTIRYGREVGVEVLAARAHWALTQVCAGSVSVGRGAAATRHAAGSWAVYGPECDDALAFDAAGEALTLSLPLHSLDAALSALLGRPAGPALRLSDRPVQTPAQRRRLADIARRLWNLDEAPGGPRARVARLQEELALYELLLAVPHSQSAALQQAQRAPSALPVRRACEFLHDRVHGDAWHELTLGDVAAYAGLGVRALCEAFRRELGVPPMRYLRELRLERARLDLLAGQHSVTEAATRWGFWNLGDFARHYRQRYGELPRTARSALSKAASVVPHRVFSTKPPP